jgi:amidase
MKKAVFLISLLCILLACQQKENPVFFKKYDETIALKKQQNHQNGRMKFK